MSPETLRRARGKTRPLWPCGEEAPYALDNGAWTAYQKETPFDGDAFRWAYSRIGEDADWVAIPDKVGDASTTLAMAEHWWPLVASHRCPLLVIQDGMEPEDVTPWLKLGAGVFVGGTTDWKIANIGKWSSLARRAGRYCHVGRVNSGKRISLCSFHGVDSFDGTSVTQFPVTLTRLDLAVRQLSLFSKYLGAAL